MKYIVKKALTLVGTLLLVSFIAFLLFQIVPGDPVTSIARNVPKVSEKN